VNGAEGDVVVGPLPDIGDFFGPERADDFGGRAHDEGAGWDFGSLGHEGMGADDAAFTDNSAVEDGGAHADKAFVLDGTSVENGAMTHGDELADADGQVFRKMDDAAVLNVGAFTDFDEVDVAAQNRGGPDAAAGCEPNIADDDGLRSDVGGGIDLRRDEEEAGAFNRVHVRIVPLLCFFVQFPLRFGISDGVTLFTFARNMAVMALVLVSAPSAKANIGDDLGELRSRYGGGKPVASGIIFQHDGYSICVYFDGSHVAMEVYTRDGSQKDKTDITQADVDAILAKEAVGQKWNEIQTHSGKPTWLSSNGKMIARLSVDNETNAKTLMIMVNSK